MVARLVLDDGSCSGMTRTSTKKSLAGFTVVALAGIRTAAGLSQIKGVPRNEAVIAGIGRAFSPQILHEARMSSYQPAHMPGEVTPRLFDATQDIFRSPLARADVPAASELREEEKMSCGYADTPARHFTRR